MSLRKRVERLEAAAADLERDREVLTHRVSKLERRVEKLENPSAAAWTGDVATVQNGQIYLNGKPLDMGNGTRAKSEP